MIPEALFVFFALTLAAAQTDQARKIERDKAARSAPHFIPTLTHSGTPVPTLWPPLKKMEK